MCFCGPLCFKCSPLSISTLEFQPKNKDISSLKWLLIPVAGSVPYLSSGHWSAFFGSHLARGDYLGLSALGSLKREKWHSVHLCPITGLACGCLSFILALSSVLPSQPLPAVLVRELAVGAPSANPQP